MYKTAAEKSQLLSNPSFSCTRSKLSVRFAAACSRIMPQPEKTVSTPQSAADSDKDENTAFGDLFNIPEGFLPPEKPMTSAEHQMIDGRSINVRLVGNHPLWVCEAPPCREGFMH